MSTPHHFRRIATDIDVSHVVAEIDANPQLWDQHTVRKTAPASPHRAMSDMWLRYNDVAPFERGDRPWSEFNDEHFPVWYPAWHTLPSLHPIVFHMMGQLWGEMLGGILITRIPPGGRIEQHTDAGWHVETYEKFYLQLRNAPGSRFHCSHRGIGEAIEPKPGELWLFDNRKTHWVTNDSDQDRMTAIICIKTDRFGRKPLGEI